MTIIANGEKREVSESTSVATFVGFCGWKPTQVVVERNGKVMPRDELVAQLLHEGDRLEIIVPVAGGWLPIFEIFAGNFGNLIPKRFRNSFFGKSFFLYESDDGTLPLPVFVAWAFKESLIETEAYEFQDAKLIAVPFTPLNLFVSALDIDGWANQLTPQNIWCVGIS
jgi:sulfur carrier protein